MNDKFGNFYMNLGTKFVNRAGVRVNTTTNWGSVITIISKLSA